MKRRSSKPKARPKDVPVRTMVFKVAGVTMQNRDGSDRQSIIESDVAAGIALLLLREPSNPYDSNAVGIWIKRLQIGYVPKDHTERISEYLDRGYDYEARALDVSGGTDDKPSRGVNVEAAFWRGGARPSNPFAEGFANSNAGRVRMGLEPFAQPVSRERAEKKTGCLPYLLFLTLAAATVNFILHKIGNVHW